MLDAAFLEIEGVVFDTRALRHASLQDALTEHGLATPTDVGHDATLRDLVALSAARAFSAKLSAGGVALCDGALDFVREAAGLCRLAAVTRASRADADTMLRLSGLDAFFTVVVAAEDVLDGKPSPEGYRIAMERLGRMRPLAAKAAIAIEDGTAGIRAAHAAGIPCVAVGPLPAHVAMEADAYISSLAGQTMRTLEQLTRPGQERVQ